MNPSRKQLKNLAIIAAILIGCFVVYTVFFKPSSEKPLSTTEVADTAVDQDLIALLLELRAITLDESVFADPRFQSLQDFGQELVPEPVGRVNPFAPVGAVK